MRFALLACLRSVLLVFVSLYALAPRAWAQGQFLQPTVIPTGNWPVFVATADVNNDGIPDLIYIDAGATATASTTQVLLGDGKGGFKESAKIATAGDSVAIGNFAGNGKVDIAWLTAPAIGTAIWHYAPGTGMGGFASTVDGSAIALNTTKLNQFAFLKAAQMRIGNGATQDIVAVDLASSSVFSFPTQPMGPPVTYTPLVHGTGPVTIADLNGDGRDDIIVDGLADNTAQTYLGDAANLAFNSGAGTVFAGLTGVHSLLVKDVNQDGRPDLIVEGAKGHIDVFFGNGDGTFNPSSQGGTGPLDGTTGNGGHLIAAADLIHNGQLDALTITPAGVSSLLGQGTQYLGLKGIYNAGPAHNSYVIADFDGNGSLDLAVDSPEGIAILYGDGQGGFRSSQAYAAGQPALSGALGVFTSSGKLDAVVSTGAQQAQVLLGAGDGTFLYAGAPRVPVPTTTQTGTPGLFGTVLAGDFNGDGNLDIALTQDGSAILSTGPGLVVQYGDGKGGFATPFVPSAPVGYLTPRCSPPIGNFPSIFFGTSAIGDLNGDGIADIANLDVGAYRVMKGVAGSVPVVSFYSGDTDRYGYIDCDLDAHDQVIVGDLNGDKHPDLIYQDEGALNIFINDGNGNFGQTGDLSLSDRNLVSPGSLPAPDLYRTFGGPSNALGFNAFLGSGTIADLDGDGNNDLIVAYDNLGANHQVPTSANPNFIYIWYGSGGGRFLTSAKHPVNPIRFAPSRNFYQLVVADLNGDGIPDLVMSDGYVLSVQYGVGDGTFGKETHYLAGQGLNTISVGDVNGDGSLDLVVANGGVVFGNPVANKEVLATNPDVNTGGITVLLNGLKTTAVTGSLSATPEPSAYAAAFSLTATLNAPSGGPAPTGTVTFAIDGTSVGSAPVSNGVAILPVPSTTYSILLPGKHALTAKYSGDSNYRANPSLTGTHTVSLAPTTVTLTPTTALTIFYGQAADGTFAPKLVDPTNHPATGNYTLDDNGVDVSICTSLPITATCPYGNPVLLDVGTHAFIVKYLGDSFNAASVSNTVTFTVLADLTKGLLTTSLTTAAPGQAVTLTAIFSGNYATPVGPVTLVDGAVVLASGKLDATGTFALTTTTLPLGLHIVTAIYPATLDFNAATSNSVKVLIKQPPVPLVTRVTLVSDANPSTPGQLVTFTASVSTPGPFIQIPTGSVSFLDGTNVLATAPLDQYGVAIYQTSALSPGTHPMTASYAGDAASGGNQPIAPPLPPVTQTARTRAKTRAHSDSQGSTPGVSAVLNQIVTNPLLAAAPGFTLTVLPVPVTVITGRTAVLLVNTLALSGFSQPIALTCSGLPTESTCTFDQATIPAGGSTALQVSTMAPHDCAVPGAPYFGSNRVDGGMMAASLLAGIAVFFVPGHSRRRRWLTGMLALIAAAGLSAMTGCGRCTDLGTKPGTYTFTVTGTASGATQSQIISLTVTIP